MEYNQSGNFIAIAGVLVALLSHFNIIVGQSDAVALIAGVVSAVGVIKQFIAHKKLAQATGAYHK